MYERQDYTGLNHDVLQEFLGINTPSTAWRLMKVYTGSNEVHEASTHQMTHTHCGVRAKLYTLRVPSGDKPSCIRCIEVRSRPILKRRPICDDRLHRYISCSFFRITNIHKNWFTYIAWSLRRRALSIWFCKMCLSYFSKWQQFGPYLMILRRNE